MTNIIMSHPSLQDIYNNHPSTSMSQSIDHITSSHHYYFHNIIAHT